MWFYLLSLGCPKNDVDSEGMRTLLFEAGHREAEDPHMADVLIVNTCGFIEAATEESLGALRSLADEKGQGQHLVAAGCLAQRMGVGLLDSVEGIDAILGTLRWREIVSVADKLRSHRPLEPMVGVSPDGQDSAAERRLGPGRSAYVRISEGCDGPCAFCVIPSIKGSYRSRPRQDILREVRSLARQGAQEIVLIGQNTTAYGLDRGETDGLASILGEMVWEVPWIRLMYAHPKQVSPRLIETMATHQQVCHYLDLPLQHAHPGVLRRMGRPIDSEEIMKVIDGLRAAMPDVSLRTSFIVGYPGETEEEFETLLGFMEQAMFDKVGLFKYSQEEGTPAASMPDQVPSELKDERYQRGMMLQQSRSLEKNRSIVGSVLDVLVEGAHEGLVVGRSYRDAPEVDGLVLLEGDCAPGEMIPVEIVSASEYDLWGVLHREG
jgi:ribosomal protein S12 methylthiotransferase